MPRVATLLPFGLIVLSVLAAVLLILRPEGLPRLRTLRTELSYVTRSNRTLRREIEDLRWQVRSLQNEPEAIERVARDELGLVRPDEIIFQFGQFEERPER